MLFHTLIRTTAVWALCSTFAMAHCDGIDGPVVIDAKRAFAQNNVNLVLLWVRKADEAAIQEAFVRAQEVRKLGGEAERLAEQFFFETLVRLHRASEGASYTGLKPAGRDLGPAIPAGDKAVETGNLKAVWDLIREDAHKGLHQRFEAVQKAKLHRDKNPESGRKFVAAYVDYIHYVVNLHEQAVGSKGNVDEKQPRHSCGDGE
ncbi:MAG: DUF6448 family protein [Holophaga sp.]